MLGNADCGAIRQEYNERCKNANPRTAEQKRNAKIKKVNDLSRVCPKYLKINPFNSDNINVQGNAAVFDNFYTELFNRNMTRDMFDIGYRALYPDEDGNIDLEEMVFYGPFGPHEFDDNEQQQPVNENEEENSNDSLMDYIENLDDAALEEVSIFTDIMEAT